MDIQTLVRGHPGKYTNAGDMLWAKERTGYKLPKDVVEDELLSLIQGVDKLDIYHNLFDNKDSALEMINRFALRYHKRFRFVYHYVSEDRGIFTNLIHSMVIKKMGKLDIQPFLYYPNGVVYLVEEDKVIELPQGFRRTVSLDIMNYIKRQNILKVADAIKGSSNGIRVGEQALRSGVEFDELFSAILSYTEQENKFKETAEKHFKQNPMNEIKKRIKRLEKKRRELQEIIEKKREKIPDFDPNNDEEIKDMREQISRQEGALRETEDFVNSYIPNQTTDVIKISRLLQAIYNTIADIERIKGNPTKAHEIWQDIAEKLDVGYRKTYDIYGSIHALPVIFAEAYLKREGGYGSLKDEMKMLLKEHYSSLKDVPDEEVDVFEEYLNRNLFFSFEDHIHQVSEEVLKKYASGSRTRCSMCGTPFEVNKMVSKEVPGGELKVKNFSNRLSASQQAPYRKICPICRYQLVLQRNCFSIKPKTYPDILYLVPRGFFPDIIVKGFQQLYHHLNNAEVVNMDVRKYIKDETGNWFSGSDGISLSKYEEVINTSIPLQLNIALSQKKEGNVRRFERLLMMALRLATELGTKVIHSTTIIPPVASNEVDAIYLDDVQELFRGIVKKNFYDSEEAKKLRDFYYLIAKLAYNVGMKRTYDLIEATKGNIFDICYVVGKKIDNISGDKDREILGKIEEIARRWDNEGKEVKRLSYIKELAEIARKHNIKGDSFKAYSLASPLDICKDACLTWNKDWADIEDLKAGSTQEIEDHLTRLVQAHTEYKGIGKVKREGVKSFVDYFVDKIFMGIFKGDIPTFEREYKKMRRAYIFYISSLYSKKEEEVEKHE